MPYITERAPAGWKTQHESQTGTSDPGDFETEDVARHHSAETCEVCNETFISCDYDVAAGPSHRFSGE
jgi:hypothetical protein